VSLLLRCPDCDAEMRISRRHRGRAVPCPRCTADVDVPSRLAFRDTMAEAVSDRRTGHWYLTLAWVAGLTCLPVAPAIVWFLATRRMQRAREDGREVVGPLQAARLVSVTAFCCHLLYIAAGLYGRSFVPLRFFMIDP
jgi:hypothetical protein